VEIYLDNSATTKVLPEVAAAMAKTMVEDYGNPSSLHGKGVASERLLTTARRQIATLAGVDAGEIFFTSGGTEANNWAIRGAALQRQGRGRHIITTQIEHPSVLASCQLLEEEGFAITYLPVNQEGLVSGEDLRAALRKDTILLSIIHTNNEVGTIQPIEEFGQIMKELAPQALFHVDGVQSFGKLPIPIRRAKIDLLSITAHKIHGPKGSGALYIKQGVVIKPLLVGGEQEGQRRGGTENLPGIVGFGLAAEKAGKSIAKLDQMAELKKYFLACFRDFKGIHLNSSEERGLPYILNLWFDGVDKAEVLLHMLEENALYVSTGSACHSKRDNPSHVLKAMGKKEEALYGAIRVSLSVFTDREELARGAEIIKEKVRDYREFKGVNYEYRFDNQVRRDQPKG